MSYYKCEMCGRITKDDFIVITPVKGFTQSFKFCDDCIRDYDLKIIDISNFSDLDFEKSEPLQQYELSKKDVDRFLFEDKILLVSKAFLKDLKKILLKEKEMLEIKISEIVKEVSK